MLWPCTRALCCLLCLAPLLVAQQPPAWEITAEDARTGATRLLTTLSVTPGSPLGPVSLALPCSGHLTGSVTLTAGDAVTFDVKSEQTITLPVRLDDEPPLHAGWANLSPHRLLIYNLRDVLPSHRRMAIDLPFSDAGTHTVTFDLTGLAPAMHNANCRRRLQ